MYCYHLVIVNYDQKYKKLIIPKMKFGLVSKREKKDLSYMTEFGK